MIRRNNQRFEKAAGAAPDRARATAVSGTIKPDLGGAGPLRFSLGRGGPNVVQLLDWIPAVARWLADRYFVRLTGRRLPPHIKSAKINRSTGAILFSYEAPIDQAAWLEGWEASEASGFFRGYAQLLYPGWCVPNRAFHRVAPDSLRTLWVLIDEGIGRGIVHVV
jgi:hypothetical protein